MTTMTTENYVEGGLLFEDSGCGFDLPIKALIEGPLGDLLFAIADLAVGLAAGGEHLGELLAEHGSSWVFGGFDPADANAYASSETAHIRSALGRDEAKLADLEARLAAGFPVLGPPAPAPTPTVEAYEPF
jgi:hypothetical protein